MIRLAFACLAVVLAVSAAGAHGPITKKYLADPPPGTAVPQSTPLASPVDAGSRFGVPTTGVRSLRQLAGEATAIVFADAARSESYDEDRLRLYRLHVLRVLRGRVDAGEPGVVEVRGASRRPALVAEGERGVFLLRPAAPSSYVAEHLVPDAYFTLVAARDGIVPIGSEAELAAVERALAAGAAVTAADDGTARRRLAFGELASPSPRLALDAVVELRGVGEIGSLGDDERAAVGRVLADVHVPAATRIGLIDLLAERHVVDALPALSAATADTPEVLDALLAARTRLGAPPARVDIAGYLMSPVPGIRAAAVRALARLDDPGALDQVGSYATADRDVGVREAAIEALGATGRPAAVPILARTFGSAEREVKQSSGRALLRIGGPAAANALVDLALNGASTETQTYAALLLLVSHGRDDPAVRRLVASNPGPEVRHLLEHGLEFHESHVH